MKTFAPDRIEESIKTAVEYIRKRRTPDGGYFFARIPPASLLDTFYAVESLSLVGLKPDNLDSLEQFVFSFESDYASGNIHALFLATSILKAINRPVEPFFTFGKKAASNFNLEEINNFERLDVEVVSELVYIYEAVTVFTNLNMQFDKKLVVDLVLSLFNTDGGFGRNRRSTLATTCYAIRTLKLLGYPQNNFELTLDYLNKNQKDIYFIEDLFYLTNTRFLLGELPSPLEREKNISSILEYQGSWGGFARSKIMGIQTLEYTWYAISLLNLLEAIPGKERILNQES